MLITMSSEVSLLWPLSDTKKGRVTSYKVSRQINSSRLLSDAKIKHKVESLFDPCASPPSGSSGAQESLRRFDTKPCFQPFRNLRRH